MGAGDTYFWGSIPGDSWITVQAAVSLFAGMAHERLAAETDECYTNALTE